MLATMIGALWPAVAAQDNSVVAVMSASEGYSGKVTGTVRFSQKADDPLADVNVEVNIAGLREGLHGFHVHQNGDTRVTSSFDTMDYHFVPICLPPPLAYNDVGVMEIGDDWCTQDQTHGYPPSIYRQPGDMGNISVADDGTCVTSFTLGQQKMSLSDPLRSIVGRSVVVHTAVDNGEQPYGGAGPPQAYGLIGIAAPDASTGPVNAAVAPNIPKVTKIVCTFEESPATEIEGFALLTLLEPDQPNRVRMQALLSGLEANNEFSFHFHTSGDMTVPYTELGAVYSTNNIEVEHLFSDGVGNATYNSYYDLQEGGGLLDHVGRSLTVHAGPELSTPTIAAAVCGLAHPSAELDTGEPSSSVGLSGGLIALIVITSVVVASIATLACLYCFRLPIPLCGSFFYPSGRGFINVPPPPPNAKTLAAAPGAPPVTDVGRV